MTVDDRGREAADDLHRWAPAAEVGVVKARARRHSNNRRIFAAGVASIVVAVVAVGVAGRSNDDQPVIVGSPSATTVPDRPVSTEPTSTDPTPTDPSPTDPLTAGQAIGDLTFAITQTSRCADFTREPGSVAEACPEPVMTTGGGLGVFVRRSGEPPDATPVQVTEGAGFPEGTFVATAATMLTDWGCRASSEIGFTVAGSGAARIVTVDSIDGRSVDVAPIVGAPSVVRLTVEAGETSCTGGLREGPRTSVRVAFDLTARSLGLAVDGPSVTVIDLDTDSSIGGWDEMNPPYPLFLAPGRYGLAFTAAGSSCPDPVLLGGTRLVVGDDGSLTLGDPANPDDAVPVPITVPAPPATPTLIPDDLVATVELRPTC